MTRVLKTVDEDHYVTLDKAELLRLTRDQLRGKESDHFRLSNIPEDAGGSGRVQVLEEQIVRLREKEAALKAEVEAEEAEETADES